jgi:hypothetical protein
MAILIDTRTGPVIQGDGAGDQPLRQGRMGSLITADGHGRYFEQASRRNIFRAHAIVTGMVAFSTAAATGGPLLWNSSSTANAVLLAVGFGITTASGAAGAVGITGNTGQTSAPGTTTAIDSFGNGYIGGPPSAMNAYRIGTVTNAGAMFLPFAQVHTGALTVDSAAVNWFDLGGGIIVPPNAWASVAASTALTSAVMSVSLVWEEVPIGN